MSNKKSLLEIRKEDLEIYIETMMIRAKDVEICSQNKYRDLHNRILELEEIVRKMVIRSYQIKDLSSDPKDLGYDYDRP